MEELENIETQVIEKIDAEDKKININLQRELTLEELMAIESIKKLRNPFMMIDVVTVMKDLHICKSIAYRLFQRKDFPSINIGKSNQIMLLPYMIWKMQKRV